VKRIPSYSLHKATGQARVRINGKTHYLGKYGTSESKARYDALIAGWLNGGDSIIRTDLTVGKESGMDTPNKKSRWAGLGSQSSC